MMDVIMELMEMDEMDEEFPKKDYRRAERRHMDWTKAKRKQHIAQSVLGNDVQKCLHAYADNKLHCSCPLCAAKTNKKGVAKHQGSSFHRLPKNFKPSEVKKWARDVLKMSEFALAE